MVRELLTNPFEAITQFSQLLSNVLEIDYRNAASITVVSSFKVSPTSVGFSWCSKFLQEDFHIREVFGYGALQEVQQRRIV